jgi:hypothetical protein
VPEWAKAKTKPTYTASEVGADPKGSAASALGDAKKYTDEKLSTVDVSQQISSHNINTAAHNDIRLKVQEVTNRLNAFLNTDDVTLDQLSEIVEYIKDNKELIDGVTTTKVNISDIVDNLTTQSTNKPLSAKQGTVLKSLIDAITVPTKVSQLSNDAGYIKSIPNEYVTESEIEGLTDDILNKAKQSGEFDGKDGLNGVDGKDGISATHEWNGTTLTITSASGTSSADLKGADGKPGENGQDGYTPQKGVDYFDGVSVTHSWDGTVLTVTSASGTTSVDLKGADGKQGEHGADGYTPVKGVDYMTSEDLEEIAKQVDIEMPTVDQAYNAESENAQSGKAIEGELAKYVKDEELIEIDQALDNVLQIQEDILSGGDPVHFLTEDDLNNHNVSLTSHQDIRSEITLLKSYVDESIQTSVLDSWSEVIKP